MKTIMPLLFFLLIAPGIVSAQQTDPYVYNRSDTTNLGNISAKDYEISVLTTFPQANPYRQSDMSNPEHRVIMGIHDFETPTNRGYEFFDLNKDGVITRDEFHKAGGIGGAQDFETFDKNKDGFITTDEYSAALTEKRRASVRKKETPEKEALKRHERAFPTIRVRFDEIEGYYVK